MANSGNSGKRGRPFLPGQSGNPNGRPKGRTDSVERTDGWKNVLTGIGTARDKRRGVDFCADICTNQEAKELWRGDDMAARIINTIPNEAMRPGFRVKMPKKSQGEAIDSLLEELGTSGAFIQAKSFARAYGGGAIFPVINDGAGDLRTPLNEDRISTIDHLKVYEPRELWPTEYYTDPLDAKYGKPSIYRLVPITSNVLASSFNFEIHESRLIIFHGIRVSREQPAGANTGWDDSVLSRCKGVLADYSMTWSAAAALVNDFAQAVLQLEGLGDLVARDGGKQLQDRLEVLDIVRSVTRMMVIDKNDAYERKTTPIGGLPEMLDRWSTRLAAAADMPVTLLMGQSPAGMNATGASDIRFFYDRVAVAQNEMQPLLERLVYLVLRSNDGPTKGKEPAVWSVEFNALWEPSEKEAAEARLIQAQVDQLYLQNQVLTPDVVLEHRFGGDVYSYDTRVDVEELKRQAQAENDALAAGAAADLRTTGGGVPGGIVTPGSSAPVAGGAPGAMPTTGGAAPAGADIQSTVLNGAQVSSLVSIVSSAAAGEISRDSAAHIIMVAYQLPLDRAMSLLGPEGFEPASKAPAPGPGGRPTGAPPTGSGGAPPSGGNGGGTGGDGGPTSTKVDRADMIERRGSKWVVLSADGEDVLGKHDTKADAIAQLQAIEAAKHAAKYDWDIDVIDDAEREYDDREYMREDDDREYVRVPAGEPGGGQFGSGGGGSSASDRSKKFGDAGTHKAIIKSLSTKSINKLTPTERKVAHALAGPKISDKKLVEATGMKPDDVRNAVESIKQKLGTPLGETLRETLKRTGVTKEAIETHGSPEAAKPADPITMPDANGLENMQPTQEALRDLGNAAREGTLARSAATAKYVFPSGVRSLPAVTGPLPAPRPALPDVPESERSAAWAAAKETASVAQQTAVAQYANIEHRDINAALRSGEPDNATAKDLRAFIAAAPKLKADAVVYRGSKNGERLGKLNPGDVMVDLGFVSTSTERDAAMIFAGRESSVLFEIEVDKGAPMAAVFDEEREILFPPRTAFQVLSSRTETLPSKVENGRTIQTGRTVRVVRAKMVLASGWETAGTKRIDTGAYRCDTGEPTGFEDRIMWDDGDVGILSADDARTDDWDESLHPRAEDGKFGEGGGAPGAKSSSSIGTGAANFGGGRKSAPATVKSEPKRAAKPKEALVPRVATPGTTVATPTALPDDPAKYFKNMGDKMVPLDKLETTRARPEGIENGAKLMADAHNGEHDKRDPISVIPNPDGTYKVVDGNSTTNIAEAAGWKELPVHIETPADTDRRINKEVKSAEAKLKYGKDVYKAAKQTLKAHADGLDGLKSRLEEVAKGKVGQPRDKTTWSALDKVESKRLEAIKDGKPIKYKTVADLQDLSGARVVSANIDDVRATAAAIADRFEVIGKPDDYIEKPLDTGYRSYHMIIKDDDGLVKEIQIRTPNQDKWAIWGHDPYKPQNAAQKAAVGTKLAPGPRRDEVLAFGKAMAERYLAIDKGEAVPEKPPQLAQDMIDIFGRLDRKDRLDSVATSAHTKGARRGSR